MNYLGLSSGFHDAASALLDQHGNILFAGHSERYSKFKHDKDLCTELIKDTLSYHTDEYEVHYYERPILKAIRQWRAGQKCSNLTVKGVIGESIHAALKYPSSYHIHDHHLSHAAAGFQTSPFQQATIVIIDAIGEFDTITVWDAFYDMNGNAKYKKILNWKYPNSIGLFYSAMTKRVGLNPMDEEYILMGMAAFGNPIHVAAMTNEFIDDIKTITFKQNLHAGIDEKFLADANDMDLAASSQLLTEQLISIVLSKARINGKSTNLVYGGGVALNCLANSKLGNYFSKIWVMPNPGDAGSSIGAAALGFKKKIKWTDAFLGHYIPGEYPVTQALTELLDKKIVGIANGRAEFGPRAFGNRSLLADPRGPEIKHRVNQIKRRQQFRPFAPVILEEHVHKYFNMPPGWNDSRYMQVIANCIYPDLFPAIVHHDGTSRVQTVPKDESGIRLLLEKWYDVTGCPMLLNTSLNIRGEPMVNDREDAKRFERMYGIKVCS